MSTRANKEKRYAMMVDTRLCVACKACVFACKAENRVPDNFARDWLMEEVRGEFPSLSAENRSERCNHCSNTPCVRACPTGASHINEGGTVQVSRNKCTGCKACIAACPYNARYAHPEGWVDKCTFCLHRVRRGEEPACVSICPTDTLHFGDLNDPNSSVSKLQRSRRWKVLFPETGAKPNVYFLY